MAESFGMWLKRAITREGITVVEFCRRAELPRASVTGWLRDGGPRPQRHQLRSIAKGLAVKLADVQAAFEGAGEEGMSPMVEIEILNRPGEKITLPRHGMIVGTVWASRFREGADQDYPVGPDGVVDLDDRTQFFLLVEGDCMEPDYHEGEVVLFDKRVVQVEGILDGEDYAIRMTGESAKTTFKRAYADPRNDEMLVLRCANRGKHRQQMRVRKDEISLVGRAVWAMRQPRRKGR